METLLAVPHCQRSFLIVSDIQRLIWHMCRCLDQSPAEQHTRRAFDILRPYYSVSVRTTVFNAMYHQTCVSHAKRPCTET